MARSVSERGWGRDRPRGEYTGLGRRVSFKPGQTHRITIGASEAAMHLRVAGKTLPVKLERGGRMAQVYGTDGRPISFPITSGEAGIYHDGGTYYAYRDEPGIQAAGAIRRMGQIHHDAEWHREFAAKYGEERRRHARGRAARRTESSRHPGRKRTRHASTPHRHAHGGR